MATSHALEHFPCGCNAGTRLRWAFSPMKTPLHATPGIPSNRENALVWLERLACFDQCFEAGEDMWPAIGARGVASIVFRPLVMQDGDLSGLAFRAEFYRDAGGIAGR